MKKTLIALLAVMLVAVACCAIASAEEYKCNVCGTPLIGPYTTVEPTCCKSGLITYKCPNIACENHKGGSFEVEPTGNHKYTIEKSRVEATCGTYGKITYQCETEGCTATKDYTLLNEPLDHDYGEPKILRAATCCVKGEKISECKKCNFHKTEYIDLDPSKHDFQEVVVQAASCKDGKGKIWYEACKICGAKKGTSLQSKDAPAHEWQFTDGDGKKKNIIWNEPDCTTAGTSYNKCKVCGLVVTETLPADGHKAPATTEVKTSIEWSMYYPYYHIITETIHKKDVTLVIKGDCLNRETIAYKCKVCQKDVIVNKNYGDHKWEEHELSATLKTRTCSICGRSQGYDAYNGGWVTTVKGKSIADNMKVIGEGNCDGSKSVNTKEKTSTAAAKASAASTKANASGVSIPKTNDNTSTLPYVMMGIALVGIVALIASKRKVNG